MKITTKGLILAMKNIGAFLASYTASGIQANPYQFCLNIMIFVLLTTPADLFLLNHWSTQNSKEETIKNGV